LRILVQRELNRAFTLVDLKSSESEKAYHSAVSMLSQIGDLSSDDRLRMELKLRELRTRMDQFPAYRNVRAAS